MYGDDPAGEERKNIERGERHFAQDEHGRNANDHRDDVGPVSTAAAGEHADEKHGEQRTVGITEDADCDRDNGQFRVVDYRVRGDGCDDNHENSEDGSGNARGADGLNTGGVRANIREVKIFREACCKRVQRGGSRAHHRSEDAGNDQPAESHRHLVHDVMAEDLIVGRRQAQSRHDSVVNREQNADSEESHRDRQIHNTAENQRKLRLAIVRSCQHSLHVILVGAVGCHRQQRRTDERGEERIRFLEHRFHRRTERQGRVPAGLEKLDVLHSTEILFHGDEAPGDVSQQKENRENDRTQHQDDLDQIRPNDRLDAADRRVNGRNHGYKNNPPHVGVQIRW